MGPIKFLYNSKFDFPAKSLVTNTVVIARVLCISLSNLLFVYFRCYALAILTADSEEFQAANKEFEKLTSDILENALNLEDTGDDKRLVKKLHEACGFEQVLFAFVLFFFLAESVSLAN